MNSEVWHAAQEYLARGWSVLPMRPNAKITTLGKWAIYQTNAAKLEQLRAWFTGPRAAKRLGLIMGPVSGGLAIRDFDDLAAYKTWAAQFPEFSKTLPTVRTGRGRHVYFRTNAAILEKFGHRKGALEFADGELRAWSGCYTLAPPSRHESGIGYEWMIPLPAGELPLVDPRTAGMIGPASDEKTKAKKSETEIDIWQAKYWASKFLPQNDADWHLLVKLDLALQQGLIMEHAINDSLESIKRCKSAKPWAYATQIIKEHCEKFGTPWTTIQAIRVPKDMASYELVLAQMNANRVKLKSTGPIKFKDYVNQMIKQRGYDQMTAKPKKAKCHTEDTLPEVPAIPAVPEDAEVPANAVISRERILQDIKKGRKLPLKFTAEMTKKIVELIRQTLPQRFGQRHKQIFEFCRALQGMPEPADAEGVQLEAVFREWHKQALPKITTKAWEDNWFDFLESWDKVEYPYGADRVDLAFERVLKNPLPVEAEQFEQLPVKQLLSLCRELQILRNGESFFLSARTAARLLKTDPTTISRWLRGFIKVDLLHLVKAGTNTTRLASEYFYLGDISVSQGSEWG